MADKIDFSGLIQVPQSEAPSEMTLPTAPIQPVEMDAAEVNTLRPEDMAAVQNEIELQRRYGNSPASALATGAARGATLGLSDKFLESLGGQEFLKETLKRNPGLSTTGEVLGTIAPAILTEGGSLAAEGVLTAAAPIRGVIKAGSALEKVVADAIGKSGSKMLARDIVKKSLAKSAAGALEGAALETGHLITEDAIGDADFNAQNLLAHVGTGALYGGLIGGAIPGLGKVASGAGKSAAELFGKAASKYTDAGNAAKELLGLPLSKELKLEQFESGKQLLEDLPRWLREDLDLGSVKNNKELAERISRLKSASGKDIDVALSEIDTEAMKDPVRQAAAGQYRQKVLSDLANKVEQDFLAPNQKWESLSGQNGKVQSLVNDIRNRAMEPSVGIAKDLNNIKRKLNDIAENFYEGGPAKRPKLSEQAAARAASMTKDAVHSYAELVNSEVAGRISKANQNYFYSSSVLPSFLKKIAKEGSTKTSPWELIQAVASYGIGDIYGLTLYGGKKLLESDVRRRLAINMGLQKAADNVAKKVSSSVESFLNSTKRVGRPASLDILLRSPLAKKQTDAGKMESPSKRGEAFQNLAHNLVDLNSDPGKLLEKTVKAGAPISMAAPKTASAVGESLVHAVQFLNSKLPKSPYEVHVPGAPEPEWTPSSMQMAKFERYLQAVENPMSILHELESNAVTKEHIEAIKVVYPKLYNYVRQVTYDKIQKHGKKIPYAKKIQLGLLLDIPTDSSLIGKNIAALQANFGPQQTQTSGVSPAVKPTQGGASEIGVADRTASDTQAFLNRQGEA